MIRFLAKAAVEAILLVALFIGALHLYAEYGPLILADCGIHIEDSRGDRTCFEFKIYKKIRHRAPADLPPGIRIIPMPKQKA